MQSHYHVNGLASLFSHKLKMQIKGVLLSLRVIVHRQQNPDQNPNVKSQTGTGLALAPFLPGNTDFKGFESFHNLCQWFDVSEVIDGFK